MIQGDNQNTFSYEWLYISAVSVAGCRFSLNCRFRKDKQRPSTQMRADSYFDDVDFRNFSLGEGTSLVKQERLNFVKMSILHDYEQFRTH